MEWSPFFPHLISQASNQNVTFALNRAKCFNLHKLFLPSIQNTECPKLNQSTSVFQKIFWTSTPQQNPKPRAKVKHKKKKSQNCRRKERPPKSSFQMKRQKLGELCKRTHSKVVKLKKLLRLHRISLSQQKLLGRRRTCGDLDWFVGRARRMEGLLN